MIYVPLHIIREELISHYEKYHKCTSLPMICQKLRKQPDLFVSDYRNPFPESFENLADDAFIKYFYN